MSSLIVKERGPLWPGCEVETELKDYELVCRDCKCNFTFTAGEQKFFSERGFTPPTRCKNCRQARKMTRDGGPQQAGKFTPSGGYTTDVTYVDTGSSARPSRSDNSDRNLSYPPPSSFDGFGGGGRNQRGGRDKGRRRSDGGGKNRRYDDQDY